MSTSYSSPSLSSSSSWVNVEHIEPRQTAKMPQYNPVAREDSQVIGDKYRLTLLTANLLRYEYSPDGQFEDRASTFAVNRNLPKVDFKRVDKEDGGVDLFTESLHISYDGKAFSPSGFTVSLSASNEKHGSVGTVHGKFWRYSVGQYNLGGTCRTLDDVNGRTALEDGILSTDGFAVINDTDSMLFDGDWVASRVPGRIDGYLFAYGFEFRDALQAYFAVSGKQPVLPRWAFGNWWSRYYPYTADGYTGLMDKFAEEEIPMSVAVIDMDWYEQDSPQFPNLELIDRHLTSIPPRYGAPWTGYTWDKKLFPDHVAFLKGLHDRNLKVTLNTHPADGIRGYEDCYKAMCKAMGVDPASDFPIPFDCTDKKFLDAYFKVVHHPLEDEGVDFWWLDWQQGRYTKIPNVDPLWMLNHFHFMDSKRHGRPMTFSRYAGPGSHRYPIGFSGDTHVTWESLDFQPEMTATSSNIGFGWWSHDIGGHMFGYKDNELLARWTQLGVFSPILRLHSSNNVFNTREPWRHSEECRQIMTRFLQLRHQLVPYIYSSGVRATVENASIVEPIYYDYPHVADAYKYKNTYMFGTELFVAPITAPRAKETGLGKTDAWLPAGRWVDIFSHVVYDGDRAVSLYRPLDKIPVLAKEGAIVPMDGGELENGCPVPQQVEVTIVVGKDGSFELVEDDGNGSDLDSIRFSRTVITYEQARGTITIHPTSQPMLESREWTIRLPCFRPTSEMTAHAGDSPLSPQAQVRSNETQILLGSISSTETIIVTLGDEPQLRQNDANSVIENILDNMEIEFGTKTDILTIVEAKQSLHIKLTKLQALNLPAVVSGPVLEMMLAQEL